MRRLAVSPWLHCGLLVGLGLSLGGPAQAEELTIGGQLTPPAFEALDSDAEIDARTQVLAKGLRCPVCQGLSVADSSSDAAVNMKARIRELVAQGYADDQIEDYFVDRYGTWVKLDPPDEGVNRLLHLAPGLGLALGGALVLLVLRQQLAAKPPPPPPEADGPPAGDATEPALASAEVDDYTRRVLEELEEP